MLMNDLMKTEFFCLVTRNSIEVSNEKMQSAYGNFMEKLRTISQSEKDNLEIFRMLNITRIELVFLKSLSQYEQGEKCHKICLP